MYNLRHYWVKAYLKDTFFAGMTTSGRSESMHSFFDGFVNSKTMLHDFVQQYDKAIHSRRGAEKDQDFRTLNSKPTLHGDHPIEAMAAECYTRKIYEIFRKEWKASFDCGHKKVIKDSCFVTYRVGYLQGNMENWKVIECKISSDFFASCSCAKFETFGILCKHILYIMRRKLLTAIPSHYILPRWTMKAIDLVGSTGTEWRGNNDDANNEVSLLTLWSLRAKFTKLLENGRDSICEIKKLDDTLNGLLEEQTKRKKARVELNTNSSSCIPSVTQVNIPSDPLIPVTTKGRPKAAIRVKPGMEEAIDSKKKRTCTCGFCGEKGHYASGCPNNPSKKTRNKKVKNSHSVG